MRAKIVQFLPAFLAIGLIGFSYFSQWCTQAGQICFRTVVDRMIPEAIYPIFFFSLYFLPAAVALILIPRAIFNSWLKFVTWTLPLAILYIATTPVFDNTLIPFERDDAARLAGGIFTLASLALITWKYISLRRGK